MKFNNTLWFETFDGNLIGIVMVSDDVTGERKAYIGTGSGIDELVDTHDVCKYGSKFGHKEAEELFNYFFKGL